MLPLGPRAKRVANVTPAELVNCQVKVTWDPAVAGEGVAVDDTTFGGVAADAAVEERRGMATETHAVTSRVPSVRHLADFICGTSHCCTRTPDSDRDSKSATHHALTNPLFTPIGSKPGDLKRRRAAISQYSRKERSPQPKGRGR